MPARTLPLLALALLTATLPAQAQPASPPAVCDEDDVLDVDVFAHRGEGENATITPYDDMTGNLQEGDQVDLRVTTTSDCQGEWAAAVAFLASGDGAGFPYSHDEYYLSSGNETSVRLFLEIPPCAYEAAVAIGDVVIDEDAGGDGECGVPEATGECDAGDVEGLSYFFAHVDLTSEMGDDLTSTRQGDFVFVEATTSLDCEGAGLIVTTYTRPGLEAFDQTISPAGRLVPQADFAYASAVARVPDCAFRIEVALETGEGNVTLEQFDGGEGSCDFAPLPCPGDVAATAGDDGILITYDEIEPTNGTGAIFAYGIWRAEGDAEFDAEPYAIIPASGMIPPDSGFEFEPGQFLDEDVDAGVTYRYFVKAGGPRGESEGCPILEATAIPFFGAPVLGGLAAVGVVGAYVAMRRLTGR